MLGGWDHGPDLENRMAERDFDSCNMRLDESLNLASFMLSIGGESFVAFTNHLAHVMGTCMEA